MISLGRHAVERLPVHRLVGEHEARSARRRPWPASAASGCRGPGRPARRRPRAPPRAAARRRAARRRGRAAGSTGTCGTSGRRCAGRRRAPSRSSACRPRRRRSTAWSRGRRRSPRRGSAAGARRARAPPGWRRRSVAATERRGRRGRPPPRTSRPAPPRSESNDIGEARNLVSTRPATATQPHRRQRAAEPGSAGGERGGQRRDALGRGNPRSVSGPSPVRTCVDHVAFVDVREVGQQHREQHGDGDRQRDGAHHAPPGAGWP